MYSYTSSSKGYFLDSSKPGGKSIWYQRSVEKYRKVSLNIDGGFKTGGKYNFIKKE